MIEQIPINLLNLINSGESTIVEYKIAKKELPDSLFETVCSMLNRNGGHIFLGVKDDGTITGIYKDYVKQMKRDFANLCNNPEKIYPTAHLEIKEYMFKIKKFFTFMFMKVQMSIKHQTKFMIEMKMEILKLQVILR